MPLAQASFEVSTISIFEVFGGEILGGENSGCGRTIETIVAPFQKNKISDIEFYILEIRV